MQYRPTSFLSILTIFTALCLFASLPASAAQLESIEPTVWNDGVEFSIPGKYDGVILTVGEPDGIVTSTTLDSNNVAFYLTDDEGNQRPDGFYSYQLEGMFDGKSTLLRSGHFSIQAGSFVPMDVLEDPLALEKTVITDDLTVRDSVCIGTDCSDSESFGFATLKLKENNTRILFEDTSTGTFPSADWMLIANETANGGADLFSIENRGSDGSSSTIPFTILGTASDNALYVGDGKVGLGTSTPAVELHIVDGDSPALRLQQDMSSGFANQIWDVAANETNFFIRDVTNSSRLPFKIRPGAATDSLVIDAEGEVAIGKSNASAALDVDGDIAVSGTVDGRDIDADGSTLDAHVADLDNPHQVNATQLGAVSQVDFDVHVADFGNPHQVTAAQVGADPSGTAASAAASAIAAHEASYDHSTLASSLPVPVSEGGTGATDAETARANLGIAETKAGVAYAVDFSGNPATATVVFSTAYDPGTSYAVSLTAVTNSSNKTYAPTLMSWDENGFTITLGGQVGNLTAVHWQTRPVGD